MKLATELDDELELLEHDDEERRELELEDDELDEKKQSLNPEELDDRREEDDEQSGMIKALSIQGVSLRVNRFRSDWSAAYGGECTSAALSELSQLVLDHHDHQLRERYFGVPAKLASRS